MRREKQIEEIRKDIFAAFGGYAKWEEDWKSLAEAVYNAGYRKQEWISVEERLPKQLTHVIVCDEDGTVGEAFCYKEGRFEWIDSEEIAFVTHWMPLPEPPKMKGENDDT